MSQDLHPLNMSRYANIKNSCYFAGMWALLHKYNNPLINEIIKYKVNGRFGEPLKKFIIDYYNYIHTQTTPIINKQFTDFLTNIRTNLLQQINLIEFVSKFDQAFSPLTTRPTSTTTFLYNFTNYLFTLVSE